jgi:hypothetical protein
MMVKTAFICLLTAAIVPAACGAPEQSQGVLTIFFTGNELGSMQPCGCSGGQLGGLDRRYAVLNAVALQNRLIIDTGVLIPELTEQNLIKFNIIVQSYAQLGYDVVNLTRQDILIARQAGLLDGLGSLFGCITADAADDVKLPTKFTKKFTLNGTAFEATVVVAENEEQISGLPEQFSSSAGSPLGLNILILNRADAATMATVSEMNVVDLMIVPGQTDEPAISGSANNRPLVVEEGRLGKYVGKIEVIADGAGQKPQLKFSSIPVTQDIAQYQPLVELYREYQRMVKDANIIEKQPRYVLPNNLEYIGSKYCKLCHGYEYEKWMNSKQVFVPGLTKQASPDSRHADAFATLVKVNSEYDPECVICHVVGMQYQTGYISPAKTPQLKDVGCENCHGPGSEHFRSLGAIETSGPISTCTDCHTPEHSAEYNANQKQYFDAVIHWREPVSKVRVAEPNRSSK